MTNDQKEEVDEIEDIVDEVDDDGNDTTDWKAIALKTQGMAKRFQTKLQKLTEKAKEAKVEIKQDAPPVKQEGLDRIDRAVLRTEKITSESEIGLVESIMKETGKSVEQVLESKYFQTELKEMREQQASKDAIPSGTKRSGNSSRDSVDYWLAKGELPPAGETQLRRDVVNARLQKEKSKSMFSDNPIV